MNAAVKPQMLKHEAVLSEDAEAIHLENTWLRRHLGHHFRTPLNAVIGFSDVMQHGRCSREERSIYLVEIEKAAMLLLKQVEGLIVLASREPFFARAQTSYVESVFVAEAVAAQLSTLAAERSVSIRVQGSERSRILTSYQGMKTALYELIDNAVRYSRAGTTVDVQLIAKRDGGMSIVIENVPEDEGPIFPAPAFYRVKGQNAGGLGIGLSVCEKLIGMMQGRLGISTEGVGRRVKACVDLPAVLPEITAKLGQTENDTCRWVGTMMPMDLVEGEQGIGEDHLTIAIETAERLRLLIENPFGAQRTY